MPSREIEANRRVQMFLPRKLQPLFGTVLGVVPLEPRAIVRWRYPYAAIVAEPLIESIGNLTMQGIKGAKDRG